MADPVPLSGTAPVTLADLVWGCQAHPGARPRPVAPGSDEMRPVPVRVILTCVDAEGKEHRLALYIDEWCLTPYRPASSDPVRAVREPALTLKISLPDLFTVSGFTPKPVPDPSVALATTQPGLTETERVIPELAHLDPAIWRTDTDRPAGAGIAKSDRVPNLGAGV